jgi:hypothetical protein
MQMLQKKLLLLFGNDMHLNHVKNKYFSFSAFIKSGKYITM